MYTQANCIYSVFHKSTRIFRIWPMRGHTLWDVTGVVWFLLYTDPLQATECYSKTPAEVCQAANTEMPHMTSRGPDILVNEETFHRSFCDVYAIEPETWYVSRRKMAEVCPDMYMCGTVFPIWLKEVRVVPGEGISNLTACLRYYDSCCMWTYSVAAVHCGAAIAYCFNELPSGCHQRYCFSNEEVYVPTPSTINPNVTYSPFEKWKRKFIEPQAADIASAKTQFDEDERNAKLKREQDLVSKDEDLNITSNQLKFDEQELEKKMQQQNIVSGQIMKTAAQQKFDEKEQERKRGQQVDGRFNGVEDNATINAFKEWKKQFGK